LCLQAEVYDDARENSECGIPNNSSDVVTVGGIHDVQQVNTFTSNCFVTDNDFCRFFVWANAVVKNNVLLMN